MEELSISAADASQDPVNEYDEAPYFSTSFPQTHIAALAAIAQLFGVDAPDPRRARVLEIGCASGGNLLPMATEFPGAEFLGIDLSNTQIAMAEEAAKAAGLENVEFRVADLSAFPKRDEPFDYIISHGVFSWIPPAIGDAMLKLASDNLAPKGVCYISYNAYPGWHMRSIVRDVLLFHAQSAHDPREKLDSAATILKLLVEKGKSTKGVFWDAVRQEMELLRQLNVSYLLHEHFETENHPLYFIDFMKRAAAHGLAYLSESEIHTDILPGDHGVDDALYLALGGSDRIRQEQYRDYFVGRAFRQTLLVKDDIEHRVTLDKSRLAALHYYVNFRRKAPPPATPRQIPYAYVSTQSRGDLNVRSIPVLAALETLLGHWFAPMSGDELFRETNKSLAGAGQAELARGDFDIMLGSLVAKGFVTPRVAIQAVAATATERPRTTPLIRHLAAQAANGDGDSISLPSLFHINTRCTEPERQLLLLLDGTLDHKGLLAQMLSLVAAGVLTFQERDGKPLADFAVAERLMTNLLPSMLDSLQGKGFILPDPVDERYF